MSVAEKNDTEFNSFYVSSQWLPVSRGMLCHVLFSVAEDARKRGLCSHTLKSSCVFPFFKRFFLCVLVFACMFLCAPRGWWEPNFGLLQEQVLFSPEPSLARVGLLLKFQLIPQTAPSGYNWSEVRHGDTHLQSQYLYVGGGDSEFEDSLRNIVKPHLEKL